MSKILIDKLNLSNKLVTIIFQDNLKLQEVLILNDHITRYSIYSIQNDSLKHIRKITNEIIDELILTSDDFKIVNSYINHAEKETYYFLIAFDYVK